MYRSRANVSDQEPKIIISCDHCSQKFRIPKRKKKLIVTCPICHHEFPYRYYALGFSSSSKRPLFVGLVGSFAGFVFVEILVYLLSNTNVFLASMLTLGAFGTCFGMIMGAAEGFFKKNHNKIYYGLKVGFILGLVSGILSGLIAQAVFSGILLSVSYYSYPSVALVKFARIVGWCVLGLLLGASYGIKENTFGDVKYGLIGGAVGGAVGGLLFDPLSSIIQIGNGTIGRLIGFLILGIAISIAVKRFQEGAISNSRPEMYRQLTDRLPRNSRLLPPPSSSRR